MLFANEQRRHVPQRRVKPKAWTVYLDHSVLYGTYYPSGVKRVRRGYRNEESFEKLLVMRKPGFRRNEEDEQKNLSCVRNDTAKIFLRRSDEVAAKTWFS